jgi:hypothetical protein
MAGPRTPGRVGRPRWIISAGKNRLEGGRRFRPGFRQRIEKNFELSGKSAVCIYGTWLAMLPRHHSPLVVVAPGPIAPVFFGAGSARRSQWSLAPPAPLGAAALLESKLRLSASPHTPYVSTRNRSPRRRAVRPPPDPRHVGPSVCEWANPYWPPGRIYPDGHLGPRAANARARGLLRRCRRHTRHADHAAGGKGRHHPEAADRPCLARTQARFRQLRHLL